MSDTDQNLSNQSSSEAENEDDAFDASEDSVIRRARRHRAPSLQTVVVALLLAGAFGYAGYSMLRSTTAARSHLARGPNVNGTPAGPEEAHSERYQNSVDSANRNGASRARENGSSFIATPDQALRTVDQKPDAAPSQHVQMPVAPPNIRPEKHTAHIVSSSHSRQQPRRKIDYDDINKLAQQMKAQEVDLMKQWSAHTSANTVVLKQDLYKSPEQRRAAAAAARKASRGDATPGSQPMLAKAGHFVFARTLNASDSDTPGPVVVEIFQQGPLYRARLIGSFSKNRNTNVLIVRFKQLVLPDGRELPISAYAVDGRSTSIAVKSGVDHRYLQRYGPLLAGAFIAGLGETLSKPDQSIVIGNNTTTVVTRKQQMKDALYSGAGRVGQKLASDVAQSAPKGPLVKLAAGYTVGVLFMKNVPMPQPGLTAAN